MTTEAAEQPSIFDATLAGPLADWHRNFPSILSANVENALHGKKSELLELSAQLVEAVRRGLQSLPADARSAVLSSESNDPVSLVYRLGQLSFAQLLISQTANRRADDDFEDFINSERYIRIARAIQVEDKSVQQIRARTSITMSDLTQRMREMVHKGVCDFRSNGKEYVYFLTPAAKSVLSKT